MRQPESEAHEWLSLSAAASRLNVHPTTLRRWADEGQVAVMLTPGGHRRFAASDIAAIADRRHTVRGIGPVERIWAERALAKTRSAIMGRDAGGWLGHYDSDARLAHRELGQQLMAVTLRHLTADDDSVGAVEEAREIGRRYGRAARAVGLPLTGVLQAAMFFRDTLVSEAVRLQDEVRIPSPSQLRMLSRISDVLNAVQLGAAEKYDEG